MKPILLYWLFPVIILCGWECRAAAFARAGIGPPTYFVIRNVNVIPMTSPNKILYHTTVVIKNGRIESLNGSVSKQAVTIDGKDKWLIPGLIDMHVHLPTDFSVRPGVPTQPPDITFNTQDIMTPYITNGVTTIVNLNATMESFWQRKEIEKGYAIGPRMALAALINGGDGTGRTANTPEEVDRQFVMSERKDMILLRSIHSLLLKRM